MERRRSREIEQQRQILPGEGYFGRHSVSFLGTRNLTECSAGSTRADRLRVLLRQRQKKELRIFAAEIEATEEQSEQSEGFWRTLAGFGFIKHFPSPGYEV